MSAAATAVSFTPGFLFPVALGASVQASAAASFLLAYAITTSLNGICGNSLELSAINSLGKHLQFRESVSLGELSKQIKFGLTISLALTALIQPPLTFYFANQLNDFSTLAQASILLSPLPPLFAISSVFSGLTIAANRTTSAILTQFARAAVPLAVVLAWPSPELWVVALSFSAGELLRIGVLLRILTATSVLTLSTISTNRPEVSASATVWQGVSTSVWQVAPLASRAFIAHSGSNIYVLAYELSDRVFTAMNQFITTGVILRIIGTWSRNSAFGPTAPAVKVGRRHIGLVSLFLTATIIATLWAIKSFIRLSEYLETACDWSIILSLGLPASAMISTYSRLIILRNRSRFLPLLTAFMVGASVLTSGMMYVLFGAAGVVWGVAMSRVVAFFPYQLVACHNHRIGGQTTLGKQLSRLKRERSNL